ncbi:MAG: hypothetical protein ABIV63_05265, partial [Caldimonas sp.]
PTRPMPRHDGSTSTEWPEALTARTPAVAGVRHEVASEGGIDGVWRLLTAAPPTHESTSTARWRGRLLVAAGDRRIT